MSVQPFLFEPTYPPGEEPVDSQEENEEEDGKLVVNHTRIGSRAWCVCGSCEAMSSADECFCCQELEELNQKFDESGVDCIADHAKCRIVCLDADVLHTALVALHNARFNLLPDPIVNRTWRLAAYRQFTWWAHGVLGKKYRRVIPACVVKAIRKEFPEDSGHYVGFKAADLELN